ncbi:hypothetical protein [uncultured Paraglaciecola sp.]|jgi:hypothetical protein|uniref:hypothetical protein n=1 Tax=uncultured Paraglaciecola sp. TaxID=1765024 RepID=UPI0025F103A6|nr:hypothetical protein [uncultured Paraglaciecola sp.]
MNFYHVAILASILTLSSLPTIAKDVLPEGWFKAGSAPSDYKMGVDVDITIDGGKSAYIEADNAESNGFGTLMQNSSVESYLGKRVQLTVHIKTLDVTGWTGAWFRIDGEQIKPLAFDNMNNRAITETTEWSKYTMVLDIPNNATNMAYGLLLNGNGKVWFDNLSFEIVDKNTPVTDLYASKNQNKTKNLSFEND